MKQKILLLFILLCTIVNSFSQSKTGLHVTNTFHIASAGGWDYLEINPVHNWLYVSHGTQVNIVDKTTGDSVGIIERTTGVHGITFDVANGKGYTSNGKLNSVYVFDIHTNQVLATIPTGQNPDAILYETFSKKIITCNGHSNNLSIIDPLQNKVIDSVAVGGKPETAVSDGAGKIFVNIEDKNEIVVIDASTFKLIHHWGISPGEGPTGLAYDVETKRLFAGCEKMLVVIDATNGKIIDKVTIGDGCDGVAFDPATKCIYTANGEGNMTVIQEHSANKFSVLETINTKKGARTIVLDKATHTLYLPAAEFAPVAAAQKERPKMIPGTFQVLVISK